MTTRARLQERVQGRFGERANPLAKETGVIKRERQRSEADCVQGWVFGLRTNPDNLTEDLASLLGRRDVLISASGRWQRLTADVALGREVPQGVPAALLSRESTSIRLPDQLAVLWPSCSRGGK